MSTKRRRTNSRSDEVLSQSRLIELVEIIRQIRQLVDRPIGDDLRQIGFFVRLQIDRRGRAQVEAMLNERDWPSSIEIEIEIETERTVLKSP